MESSGSKGQGEKLSEIHAGLEIAKGWIPVIERLVEDARSPATCNEHLFKEEVK